MHIPLPVHHHPSSLRSSNRRTKPSSARTSTNPHWSRRRILDASEPSGSPLPDALLIRPDGQVVAASPLSLGEDGESNSRVGEDGMKTLPPTRPYNPPGGGFGSSGMQDGNNDGSSLGAAEKPFASLHSTGSLASSTLPAFPPTTFSFGSPVSTQAAVSSPAVTSFAVAPTSTFAATSSDTSLPSSSISAPAAASADVGNPNASSHASHSASVALGVGISGGVILMFIGVIFALSRCGYLPLPIILRQYLPEKNPPSSHKRAWPWGKAERGLGLGFKNTLGGFGDEDKKAKRIFSGWDWNSPTLAPSGRYPSLRVPRLGSLRVAPCMDERNGSLGEGEAQGLGLGRLTVTNLLPGDVLVSSSGESDESRGPSPRAAKTKTAGCTPPIFETSRVQHQGNSSRHEEGAEAEGRSLSSQGMHMLGAELSGIAAPSYSWAPLRPLNRSPRPFEDSMDNSIIPDSNIPPLPNPPNLLDEAFAKPDGKEKEGWTSSIRSIVSAFSGLRAPAVASTSIEDGLTRAPSRVSRQALSLRSSNARGFFEKEPMAITQLALPTPALHHSAMSSLARACSGASTYSTDPSSPPAFKTNGGETAGPVPQLPKIPPLEDTHSSSISTDSHLTTASLLPTHKVSGSSGVQSPAKRHRKKTRRTLRRPPVLAHRSSSGCSVGSDMSRSSSAVNNARRLLRERRALADADRMAKIAREIFIM